MDNTKMCMGIILFFENKKKPRIKKEKKNEETSLESKPKLELQFFFQELSQN
jgi:hypothetical protein